MTNVGEPHHQAGAVMATIPAGQVVDVVVWLVEALTHDTRVSALHEADIMSGQAPDSSAALDLRCATGRELDAAEDALTDLVDAVDHELCLALIRRLAAARRSGEARAEQAYRQLLASDPGAVRHALDTERATRPAEAEVRR